MTDSIALRTDHLTKRFGRNRLAVDDLNLSVQSGMVYGFLGPNGAGKTTTIRVMLDLVRPTHGAVYLFGVDPRRDRSVLRRAGALVEGAAFYPFLSGRANLELLRRMNHGDSQPIDTLIDRVGLSGREKDRYHTYSTGMKQRLGIAAALLYDPDLVILDEPTNGLDPVGMVEIRQLIRELAEREGKTVFLSSHLLNEVEQICDRVAIIDKGRLIREGTIVELLDARGETVVRLTVDNPQAAMGALQDRWQTTNLVGDNVIEVHAMRTDIPAVIGRLGECGIAVYEVTPQRQSLEALFLSLVDKADA